MTRVVADALRQRRRELDDQRGRASVDELLSIADRAAAHLHRPHVDHAALLYDESGLPA